MLESRRSIRAERVALRRAAHQVLDVPPGRTGDASVVSLRSARTLLKSSRSRLVSLRMNGEPDGNRTGLSRLPRKIAHRRGKFDWQIVVGNCAPDCALTGVYPGQTSSLTGRHEERCPGRQVVETTVENVIRYVPTLFHCIAFQACSFNHSDISPCLDSTTCERSGKDYPTRRRFPLCVLHRVSFERVRPRERERPAEIVSDPPISRDHLQRFRRVASRRRRPRTRGVEYRIRLRLR
jgi:hypothetical protein